MPLTHDQKKLLKLFLEYKNKNSNEKKASFKKIKELLEDEEISINFSEPDTNWTLLHYAVFSRELGLVNLICSDADCGQIIDAKTANGDTAIDLTLEEDEAGKLIEKDLEIFKALVFKGAEYDFKKIKTELDLRKTKSYKATINSFKAFLHEQRPKALKKQNGASLGIYAYPRHRRVLAQKKEFERQKRVTERFFHVGISLRYERKSTILYGKMLTAMDMDWPVKLDGHSARAVVIAVSKLLQKLKYFPPITFKIGETSLICTPSRPESRKRQVGNLLVSIKNINTGPRYGEAVMNSIRPIIDGSNNELRVLREKKLGALLKQKSKKMESFTCDDFYISGRIKIFDQSESYVLGKDETKDNQVNNAIHVLNFLNFMYMIGETTRRLYRDKQGRIASTPDFFCYGYREARESDAIPVGNLHARAIKLLGLGRLLFDDVYGDSGKDFQHRPKYGVVSGTRTIRLVEKRVKPKCFNLNEKMSEYHKEEFITPTNSADALKNHYLVTRSFQLHEELKDQFGGDSESGSDDSTYSSDSDTEYVDLTL